MHGQEPVNFDDVKDEIFDMVKPADPCKITLQDLLTWYGIKTSWKLRTNNLFEFFEWYNNFVYSGQGSTMVSILIEFHGFWAYENREAMAADLRYSHVWRKFINYPQSSTYLWFYNYIVFENITLTIYPLKQYFLKVERFNIFYI